jgi:hypothetical protein
MEQIKQIPVWNTITTAWEKTYGIKKTFWAAIGLIILIGAGLGILQGIAKTISPGLETFTRLISNIITYFLQVGLLYMGIQRALDAPVTYKQLFFAFDTDHILKLFGVYLLQIVIFIPVIILVIIASVFAGDSSPLPGTGGLFLAALLFLVALILGVYLIIRVMLGIAFVVAKDAGPWNAIKMSFQATQDNVLNLFGISLLQMLIVLISILPLLIGLIWTLPFSAICYGVIYKSLLGNVRDGQF